MYAYNNNTNDNNNIHNYYGCATEEYYGLPPPPPETLAAAPPLVVVPRGGGNEYDSLLSPMKSEIGYSSSEYSSYGASPSSATSYYGFNNNNTLHNNSDVGYYPVVSSPTGLLDSPVRKVFSTDDLQGIKLVQRNHRSSESPLASESNSIIEGMNKACRYSPQEKKERIERYRSKRNLRNFTKKIKYECRKTLADSRPRIRGRFARNDESYDATTTTTTQSDETWNINNMIQGRLLLEEDDNDDYDNGDVDIDYESNWINFQLIEDFNFQQI